MLMMELVVGGKAKHPLLPFKMGVPDLSCAPLQYSSAWS